MPAWITESEHFPTTLARDIFAMIADKSLGAGTHRHIYSHASDPNLIVKIENGAHSFSNIREWEVWDRVKDTNLAQWFAPCVELSPNGLVLIQRRCKEVTAKEMPKKVPAFFTDLKVENFGRYKNRIVCLDYGNHLLLEKGMTSRMRTVKNWT